MHNPITSVLEIWRAAKDIAALDVARELCREAFKADPRVIGIRFDFSDCDGVPYIWIEFPLGALPNGEEIKVLFDYEGPEAFPAEELEAVSYDLLRWEGKAGGVTFTRAEVMAVDPQ